MNERSLLIIGAGGHGKVVADAALLTGRWDKIGFVDDRYPELNSVAGWPVVGVVADLDHLASDWRDGFVAVGSNCVRIKLLERINSCEINVVSIAHPSAQIADNVLLGEGVIILANAVINIGSEIGDACIINTGATVDHDNEIGDGVHVSPGANLGGDVKIGDRTWVGIGASIVNGCSVGHDVIVGAGAVVTNNIGDGLTVVGVPAREIIK